ncbi:MAG: OmpA family protein [Marinicaulis sp.]|nr:OmpA family protein [Marinicaulis sp.]NNE39578.1 OmpA family protein [Marinicaulis sp.]NNL90094.1 OmpA family protein [Marinicaulis sp.]
MKLKTTLLAAAATMAIAPAANAYEGLYGAIGAGLNYMQPDRDLSNDALGSAAGPLVFDTDQDFDNGIGVYTALGYAWGNDWRTELEFSHRNNDVRHITSDPAGYSGFPAGTVGGDVRTYALMLNVLRDFDFGEGNPVKPYIGGGVGFADVGFNITGNNPAGAPVSPSTIAFGPNRRMFAYQGIAGLAFPLAEQLALDVSYRFFGTKKVAYNAVINGAAGQVEAGYHTHSLFAGLRWNFGAAAPAIQYKDCWDGSSVPMTSECPPQVVDTPDVDLDPIEFTVYFDYDKSNLTPQASTLVQEASSRALQNDIDTVVVSGNTDTSGSSAYNKLLSERRARVVRDALIANGVPADSIRTEAYGEDNPAKPTADGVREPLNRRSEVVISFE